VSIEAPPSGSSNEPIVPAKRPGLALAVVLSSQLMITLDASIVNIALPEIRSALGFSTASLSWVINAYALAFGGLLLLGARTGDILGRRVVFIAGITLFTGASLLGGFAQSPAELLIARGAQGVGAAFASPAALAVLTTMYEEGRERTKALGYYTAVVIGGAAVGLVAGGVLTQLASWRWTLFVNVPIGVVVIAVALVSLPKGEADPGHFDVLGAITSTIGMTALVYGFVRAASDGWLDPITVVAFTVGVVLLTAFVLVERQAAEPITPLRLFADRSRASTHIARLLLVAGMFGTFFFLSQYLQLVLHYSPIRSGMAFLPITIVLFATSQLTSRLLMDHIGSRVLLVVGTGLSAVGMILLTQLNASTSYTYLFFALLFFGVGNGLLFVPLTTASLDGVDDDDAGAASGLVNVTQQLGGSLGLAVLVTIFSTGYRHAVANAKPGLTQADLNIHGFVSGADLAFIVATGFILGTLVLVAFAVKAVLPDEDVPDEPVDSAETTDAVNASA
jgi:EmrB/QacA subfamily drug resistance transporter